MTDINLIPTGSAPKSSSIQRSSDLKIVAIIGTIILLFAVIVMIAIFTINSSIIKTSQAKQEQLKSQIKSLQKEETQYVLAKDRATKLKEVWSEKGLDNEMQGLKSLVLGLPPAAFMTEADLSKNKTETSFSITNSSSLSQLFANIVSSEFYSHIVMSDFTFDPGMGYQTGFELTN